MSVLSRGIIFSFGTVSNAILFLVHSRVVLFLLDIGEGIVGTGPATGALNLLPAAMQLGMGILQIGLIVYFIGGIGEEKASSRRPMP